MKSLLFMLLLALSQALFAQATDQELENKYWNYRDRLNKYFSQIGGEPGQGLTAAQIWTDWVKSDSWQFVNGTLQKITPKIISNKISFGDAVIDQGYYLAVLSSEIHLLALQGLQQTDRYKNACTELYFAIYAMDRLDQNAEGYLKSGGIKSKNGFFIRSDNDEKYMSRFSRASIYEKQRVELLKSGAANGPAILFVDTLTNNTIRVFNFDSVLLKINNNSVSWVNGPDAFGTTWDYGNEMSQDQIYGILMGFMCVKQWVSPDLEVDPDGQLTFYSSKNMHAWVAEITGRIVSFIGKKYVGDIYAGDISNYYEKLEGKNFKVNNKNQHYVDYDKWCKDVKKYPYRREDTTFLNPPDTIYYFSEDSLTHQVNIDTVVEYYRLTEVLDSLAFPGAKLRSCHIWQEAVNQYEEKSKFPIFSEANYILTNPVRNNKIVTRGHFALPFGHAIRESAKYITGADTFPFPSAKGSWQLSYARYTTNMAWIAKVTVSAANSGFLIFEVLGTRFLLSKVLEQQYGKSKIVSTLHYIAILFPEAFHSITENRLAAVLQAITADCPGTIPSLDLLSMCITGRFIEPQNPNYWRNVWNAMGSSSVLKAITRGSFTSNLQHNIALASRGWGHDKFSDWCEDMDYEYSELFYCILHGGNPKKSRSFYQGILEKAQCEGVFHAGDYDPALATKRPAYEYCKPFNTDNIFSNRKSTGDSSQYGYLQAGLDYMLLFNLYKMADLYKWNTGSFKLSDRPKSNCPCVSYPDMPMTSANRSILESLEYHQYDTIDGYAYANKQMYVPINSLYARTEKVEPIQKDYKNFQIRIPQYLLHNLNVSGTINFPTPNYGVLEVEQDLTICHSNTVLNQYGKLKLLSSLNPEFPAQTIVTKGSVLEVKNQGVVEVNNNARLIIEEGGTLKFNPGATIILNGPNAVLHIKGNLQLATNAVFKIQGGAAGKGYVIWENHWDNETNNNTAKLIANNTNSIILEQTGTNHRILSIEGNAGFKTNGDLALFKIRNARVDIGPEAFLMCESKNNVFDTLEVYGFLNVHANSNFNYKPCARGIHVLGVKNRFTQINIHDCLEGIKMFNVGGNNEELKLNYVNFVNCLTSVTNHGGRLKWDYGVINNSGFKQLRTGINGVGTQGNSLLSYVNINIDNFRNTSNYDYPLGMGELVTNVWSHGPGRYMLAKCSIASAEFGSILNQSYLIPRCSYFNNNTIQVSMTQGSRLTALNEAWNRFWWNSSGSEKVFITGTNGVFIHLDKGKNYIMGHKDAIGSKFIQASLHYSHPLYPSTGASGVNISAVNATLNEWAIGGMGGIFTEPTAMGDANVLLGNANVVGANYDLNFLPAFTGNHNTLRDSACSAPLPDYSWWPIDENLKDRTNSSGFDGLLVLQRGDSLYSQFINYPKNYPLLIQKAKQLFVTDMPDNIGGEILEVYSQVHAIYPEVFTDSTIPEMNRSTIIQATYDALLDMQLQLVTLSDGVDPKLWQLFRFEIHRDLALIHRVFGNRVAGIQHLNMVTPSFSKPADVVSLQAWTCLLEKEQSYLDSALPYWQVSLDTCLVGLEQNSMNDSFQTQWAPDWQNRYRGGEGQGFAPEPLNEENREEINSALNIQVYPNPSNGLVYIVSDVEVSEIEVYNSLGRKVLATQPKAIKTLIDMNNSADGLYLFKVRINNEQKTVKIILQR